jgi:hypothetical protein
MINLYPLSTERVSGDGYMFSYRTGKADAMVAGLFSSSIYHQGHAIYKGSKIINVVYEGKRVVDPQFLAWVDVGAASRAQPESDPLTAGEKEFNIRDPHPTSVPWGSATPGTNSAP